MVEPYNKQNVQGAHSQRIANNKNRKLAPGSTELHEEQPKDIQILPKLHVR